MEELNQLSQKYTGYTISSGTLRTIDLVESSVLFLKDARHLFTDKIKQRIDNIVIESEQLVIESIPNYIDNYNEESEEQASYLFNEDIFDLLNEIAPENTIFSAHEGDGSLFGFWIIETEED